MTRRKQAPTAIGPNCVELSGSGQRTDCIRNQVEAVPLRDVWRLAVRALRQVRKSDNLSTMIF